MYLNREVKLVVRASVFNDKTKFKKQWFDLMPYYVVSFLFAKNSKRKNTTAIKTRISRRLVVVHELCRIPRVISIMKF